MSISYIQTGSSCIEPVNLNTNLSGIADVRETLRNGIQRGNSIIFYFQRGVECEMFGLEIANNTLNRGGNCILVTMSSSPDNMKSKFKESGLNIELFKDRFFIVDAYSQLIGVPSEEKYVVPSPDNIYVLSRELIRAFKESSPSTVIIGSLSTIMDMCGEKETIEAVRVWNMMAKLCGHVLVYNFTAWNYSNEILDRMKKDLFNSVVYAGGTTERMIFEQYFGET